MALTNKNGLTPGQVTLQKEILDRFGALEAQNIELKAQNARLIALLGAPSDPKPSGPNAGTAPETPEP